MQNTTAYMGVDPDTVRPSFALVNTEGSVIWLWCPKLKGRDLSGLGSVILDKTDYHPAASVKYAAIEDQYIVDGKKADRLRKLCQNAGSCMVLTGLMYEIESAQYIRPATWNGGFEKHVSGARTLRKLGWGHIRKGGQTPYCIPENPPDEFKHILAGEWKHLVDAIGLALYAKEIHDKEQRMGVKLWAA